MRGAQHISILFVSVSDCIFRVLCRYLSLANRKPSDLETKKWFERTRSRLSQIRGWYLTFAYFCVKLLSLANVIGQLFLLNLFLGAGFHLYGFEILSRIMRGEDNDGTLSPRFPRVTMCDFKVRRLGATHRYTVQCVLPINLFNEKIYLFVWLWLVFLVAALLLSLGKWILRILLAPSRRHYIEGHLSMIPKDIRSHSSDSDKLKITRFLRHYLHYDGVFVLRLIGHNTSSITVIELAICLWDNFKKKNLIDGDQMTPPADTIRTLKQNK